MTGILAGATSGCLCTLDPSSACRRWTIDDLPAALGKAVEDLGEDVACVDLTGRLDGEAESGALVYLPDDTHWSSAGRRAAAEEPAARVPAFRRQKACVTCGRRPRPCWPYTT